MQLSYIIIPNEIKDNIYGVLDKLNIDYQNIEYEGLDLIKESPLRPTYAQALKELDLWHDINIWSNAPIMIPTSSTSTNELIQQLPINSEEWLTLVEPLAEADAQDQDTEFETIMQDFIDGPTEQFKEVMNEIRNQYRLDKITENPDSLI